MFEGFLEFNPDCLSHIFGLGFQKQNFFICQCKGQKNLKSFVSCQKNILVAIRDSNWFLSYPNKFLGRLVVEKYQLWLELAEDFSKKVIVEFGF